MKFTLYPNGYSHFMARWLRDVGDYSLEESVLHGEAIGHLEDGDESSYNDLFIVKERGKNNATYVVAKSETNPTLNAVYLVNEDDNGMPPCTHELECEKALCQILPGWKPENVLLCLRELISFGWTGYTSEDNDGMASLGNKVISKCFVTNYLTNINVRASLHKLENKWIVVLAAETYHKHISISPAMENTSQEAFWHEMWEFLARPLGGDKSQATLDMARSIFAWTTDIIGAAAVESLMSGKIQAEHHYITVTTDQEADKEIVNIWRNNKIIKTATPDDAGKFLAVFPDTVIYPSSECTKWEREVLWPGEYVIKNLNFGLIDLVAQRVVIPIKSYYWRWVLSN